jgi:flagellar hook assembly protein FlgD
VTRTATNTPTGTLTPGVTLPPTAVPTPLLYVSKNIFNSGNESVDIHVAFGYSGTFNLKVFNSAGENVRTLAPTQSVTAPFDQWFNWDGTNQSGEKVASGVYVIRLVTPFGTYSASVMVIKG